MTNLVESVKWEAGIYQLETTDPVMGGAEGIDNLQAKQLANRTTWLRGLISGLCAAEGVTLSSTTTAGLLAALDSRYFKNASLGSQATDDELAQAIVNHLAAIDPHTRYAPKASPTFTGIPKTTIPAAGVNTNQIASMANISPYGLGVAFDTQVTDQNELTQSGFYYHGSLLNSPYSNADYISIVSGRGSNVLQIMMPSADRLLWRANDGAGFGANRALLSLDISKASIQTGTNGFYTVTDGQRKEVLVQWGTVVIAAANTATPFTFPTPFGAAPHRLLPTPTQTNASAWYSSLTANGGNLLSSAAGTFSYIAIGVPA